MLRGKKEAGKERQRERTYCFSTVEWTPERVFLQQHRIPWSSFALQYLTGDGFHRVRQSQDYVQHSPEPPGTALSLG